MTYDKKIRIFESTETKDSVGNITAAWTEIFNGWASISGAGGRRYYEAAQTNTQYEKVFTIRYNKTVSGISLNPENPDYQIEYNNKRYTVKHMDDPDEKHRELVLRAEEVLHYVPETVTPAEEVTDNVNEDQTGGTE